MKRRAAERSVNDDLSSRRIVRRKVNRRTPSPEIEIRTKREVRAAVYGDKYGVIGTRTSRGGGDKYEEKYSKYEDKYDHGHSKRDEHIGKTFNDKTRHYSTHHDHPTSVSHARPPHEHRFGEYSLRVSNLNFKVPDGEVKTALFKQFKKFGYINVKVLGFGRERHAFINFTREDDARSALKETGEFTVHNHTLHVEWSRSTLNRFPELASTTSESSKRRSLASADDSYEEYSSRERSTEHYSGRNARDVSYRSSTTHSSASTRSSSHRSSQSTHHHHSTTSTPSQSSNVEPIAKPVIPVLDPNATRTLFVGNLEQDITERELRDLFGPYGRIESVDIKLHRTTGTAYAFVKFLTINDAINAKNDMHGRQYGDYRLKIGFGRGSPSAKLWVGNLSCYADVTEVRNELDRFGLIRRVDYVDGSNHAFVHFDSLDAAQAAVSSLSSFRVRSTGKLAKIDLCRPAHLRADFDDYEADMQSKSTHAHDSRRPQSHTSDESGYKRRLRDHNSTSHHHSSGGANDEGHSSNSYSYRSSRSRNDGQTHHGRSRSLDRSERNSRKRPHSPQDHYESGGYRKRDASNINGDTLYRSKRPRNGMDPHFRSPEQRKDAQATHDEPMDTTSDRESTAGTKKAPPERKENEPSEKKKKEESDNALSKLKIEPSQSDMISSDTALKLGDSTEPISPDSDTKSVKPDSTNPETLTDMAKLFPIAWRGNLVLKNTGFPTRMHLIGGDPTVAENLLRSKDGKDDLTALRITQRLRLEPPRLEEVNKRMSSAGPSGHCVLLALPGPTPSQSSSPDRSADANSMQLRPLKSLVSYLKQKEAAGIVALSASEGNETISEKDAKDVIGVLHAFPPCQFSQNQLMKIAPNLGNEPSSKEDHIVVLLVKGTV